MEQALELLDRCGDGLDVGPHLDLAICRLKERLGIEPDGSGDPALGDPLSGDAPRFKSPWP